MELTDKWYLENLYTEKQWIENERKWCDITIKAKQDLKKELIEKIELDLNAGKFNQICSNETTFKNYIINKI